jgi:hypothetical protein
VALIKRKILSTFLPKEVRKDGEDLNFNFEIVSCTKWVPGTFKHTRMWDSKSSVNEYGECSIPGSYNVFLKNTYQRFRETWNVLKGTRVKTIAPVYMRGGGGTHHKTTVFMSKAFDCSVTSSRIPRLYPLLFKNKLKKSACYYQAHKC